MPDRADGLRREAARCLTVAQTTRDPKTHDELVEMAARFHALANSADVDSLGPILRSFNDDQMLSTASKLEERQQQQQQQQQQIQPKPDPR